MKLTFLMFLLSVAQVFASNGYGQETRVSITFRETNLQEILTSIESQTNYSFVYSDQVIDVKRVVSLQCEDEDVNDVLKDLFEGTDVNYLIRDHQIILTNQVVKKIEVSGNVVDDNGEPLPGVSVVIKGTTIGTITDVNGKYLLDNIPSNSVLIFSFIGMNDQEIQVDNQSRIDVTMSASSVGVDEVVVTALGISKEKKALAYSVSEVKSDDISRAANNNLMKSLDGKVSGVNFTNLSSDPTASVMVNIRGASTMPTSSSSNVSKSGQPLYGIDGVQVGVQSC